MAETEKTSSEPPDSGPAIGAGSGKKTAQRRYLSDSTRANWSSLIAAVGGFGAALLLALVRDRLVVQSTLDFLISGYLFMWPLFGLIYLGWTHLAYTKAGPENLTRLARQETAAKSRWFSKLFGYGGASSWTLMAALVAIFLTVVIAQDPAHRADLLYVTLGLLSVASSWALMVYSFAAQYLRLQADARSDEPQHLELRVQGRAWFGDYLTLAILVSTMAATVSASIYSREAWTMVRTNVLFAFTFNSVIVAMVVSLLVGGLFA
ncbi:MAG TPA: DUF1345 domain-containing protein [Terrimesophilobacter sp.]|nr:DUF1345 domain-containing protein [Terrimesophilobacter sp.]